MIGSDELSAIVQAIPYARYLDLRAELAGDELTAVLPYSDHLIGNPSIPALHGGVIGAFLEIAAVVQLSVAQGLARQPKPIGVTVEYLRSGRPRTTYARAEIKRLGRRVANVRVEAWQDSRAAPIAALHGHFLIAPQDEGGGR